MTTTLEAADADLAENYRLMRQAIDQGLLHIEIHCRLRFDVLLERRWAAMTATTADVTA